MGDGQRKWSRLKNTYLNANHGDCKSLEFSTGELFHFTVPDAKKVQDVADLGLVLFLVLLVQKALDGALDGPRNLVHVLRLDHGLQVIFQDFREVILELRAAKVGQDLGPVGRIVKPAQIGLLLSSQNLEGRRLADTVSSNQSQDVSGPRNRKSMQFKRIGRVPVGRLLLQVGGQVDNVDGLEGTLLDAYTATDTQVFGDVGDLVVGHHLDAELAHPNDGTGLLALLPTSFGLAPIPVHDGDPSQGVTVGGLLPLVLGRHRVRRSDQKWLLRLSYTTSEQSQEKKRATIRLTSKSHVRCTAATFCVLGVGGELESNSWRPGTLTSTLDNLSELYHG